MSAPVLVVHFTQGSSIEGAVRAMTAARSQCHEVIDPARGVAGAQQLVPWDSPARSLRHPAGTPDTNNRGWTNPGRGRCYQVEIVGYSEQAADYPDGWYQTLEAYLRDRCAMLGVPYEFPCPFVGSEGYGAGAAQRLTWDQWATIAGIVGHQHVPGNLHWDPGLLDIARLKGTTTMPRPANPYPAETAEALDLLAEHAGYTDPDRSWFGPNALAALHRLKNDKVAAEQTVAALTAQRVDLVTQLEAAVAARAAAVAARDAARAVLDAARAEAEAAVAKREAAEAEAADLRRQLHEGGRLPQLLADIDAALAKARA